MEYVSQGNLLSYLQSSATISPLMKLKIAVNIADAMKCLHSKTPKIIHRDLKSPNILVRFLSYIH
jgi:serine/threonine-protein kinase CTR1